MSGGYFLQLDGSSKQRYLEKLTYKDEKLPDPLDDAIRSYVFKESSMKTWPSMFFGDIYMYLVEKECTYTNERMRNFKALDSYNYVLSGKVHNVLSYINKDLQVCVMTCEVQASQTVRKFHHPWAVISTDGVIHSGHCTCMAGLGEVCSHVAALLFTLEIATKEGVQGPSPTSLACLWNKASKKVPAAKAVDIQFSHKRKPQAKRNLEMSKMPPEDAIKSFIEIIKAHNPTAPFLTVLSDETSSASDPEALSDEETSTASEGEAYGNENVHDNERQPSAPFPLTVPAVVEAGRSVPSLVQLILDINREFPNNLPINERVGILMNRISIGGEQIAEIERSTREQSTSKEWYTQRWGRLTASLFGRILRVTNRGVGKLVQTILGLQRPFSNESMLWGKNLEETAKMKFQEYLNVRHIDGHLRDTGFLVDPECPFLGATPDGLVECDCCEDALLEIKCPSRGKGLLVRQIPSRQFCLDEELKLKKKDKYYDQVQGQLSTWKLQKCYFVVCTDVDIHIQEIPYDSKYWEPKKNSLKEFFKNHILPKMLDL